MNFKSLALGSVLALGSIFGSVAGVEARPASCNIGAPGDSAKTVYCDHFLPSKGNHVVYMNGSRFEFNLYTDGDAEISVNNQPFVSGTWMYHSQGGIQVTNNASGYFFIFER